MYPRRRRRRRVVVARLFRTPLPVVMEEEEGPWGDLPDYVLLRITAYLRCRADRVHMACVNKQWRAAVTGEPRPPPLPQVPQLPPQLPWLIFPSTKAPSFYSEIGRRRHHLPLPPDIRLARFCGSSGGGWFVLSLDRRHSHSLYNINSGQRIDLPSGLVTHTGIKLPLVVRSATLSTSPGPQAYMVAAIVVVAKQFTIAFWCQGSDRFFLSSGPSLRRPQDVIYYREAFYSVNAAERVVAFWPGYRGQDSNEMLMRRVDYDMVQREDYRMDIAIGLTMVRYLVASRGQLLMVVRYFYVAEETQMLRVFKFHIMRATVAGRPPIAKWVRIPELDGRILLLGRGCSRSFETAQFCGCQDCMIYFLDDNFNPDSTMTRGRRYYYTFDDIGTYDMLRNSVDPWPPAGRRPSKSDHAPPTWWLP
ncbi:hypothetical protein GUJ93_ZPchr0001g32141 [Zizania palustris]|uniref:KIB1-4 beta-propeller domain-containing protein n=1 Tax=Zizania palustris TaxID=103762 RepID=A0A8J5R522_ZIZPA|nr:hypothetical protein GUJ93_ZPchr0001g32141 [Zizania palustris]